MDTRSTNLFDEELYAAYASGALPAPMRLLIDTQADLNTDVARLRNDADALSGLMLETVAPVEMKKTALDEVFAAIDAEEAALGEAGTMAFQPDTEARDRAAVTAANAAGTALQELLDLPETVRDLALESANWTFAGPGVRKMALMEEAGSKAELIRLEPGCGVPSHGHNCREYTLVLTGAYHDGHSRYGVGDLSIADPDTDHKPIAEPGAICIALAVTDGPLAFKGALGWIQRAFGPQS